jgi:hypothetical protein
MHPNLDLPAVVEKARPEIDYESYFGQRSALERIQ